MPIEYERKFLVVSDEWREAQPKGDRIAQGYLASTSSLSIRVRSSTLGSWLTIKGVQVGIGRAEYEYPIPPEHAREILDKLVVGSIDKTRYLLPSDSHAWTIDVFHAENRGLALLEVEDVVEFELEGLPYWVGLEVTDDERFTNAYLSEHPLSTWPARLRQQFGL